MKQTAFNNSNHWPRCTTLERRLVLVSAFALLALPINQIVEGFKISPSTDNDVGVNIEPRNKDIRADSQPLKICYSAECNRTASDMARKINNDVNPCNDFYKFACGNFISEAEIPDDKVVMETFTVMEDELEKKLHDIVTEERPETDPKHLKLPYLLNKACMNEAVIESLDSQPMKNISDYLGGWPVVVGKSWDANNTWSWYETAKKMSRLGFGMDTIVAFSIISDVKNGTRRVISLDQPSTGLSRTILLNGFNDSSVVAYYDYMVDLAVLFGAEKETAKNELRECLQFEMNLANISWSDERRRNASDLYNLRTIKELQDSYSYANWLDYINGLLAGTNKVDENEAIILSVPSFFDDLGKLLQRTEKRVIANYMMWGIHSFSVNFLSEKFRLREFQYESSWSGIQRRSDKWKGCLAIVTNSLTIPVGSLYIRKHFNEESKATALKMVNGVIGAFRRRLDEVDWMDATTKQEAKKKLNAITAHIGYPDELLQDNLLEKLYRGVEIDAEKYFESYLKLEALSTNYTLRQLRMPVNKTDWIDHSDSYVVNAFYSSSENSIMFPAGILQGPLFNSQRPKCINYGAIGTIIGHEVIHGFDDEGRQYDGAGNLVDWWQPHTKEAFMEKARCIIEQYGNFTDEQTSLKINGVVSQGENIADNGGIKTAYLAYKNEVAENGEEPRLPGLNYSPNQLFWISAAQTWCAKFRTEILRVVINTGNHVPNQFSILGSFRNTDDFSHDFQCSEDAPMNPTQKCRLY